MLQTTVMIVGMAAQLVGWRRAAVGRGNVWSVMPWVLGGMGVAAVLVHPPVAATKTADGTALAIGAASGLLLYAGTRAFVWVASLWPRFRRAVVASYEEAADVSRVKALLLSLLVMVPAEELFWRSLFQGHLAVVLGSGAAAAALAWLSYIVANVPSGSLPIVAGAVVGGALWSGLAWWSGGVLAPLGSHILWTGLMLALPPGAGRRGTAEPT
jgi:membrane protease YdiL (CAAX protease family)